MRLFIQRYMFVLSIAIILLVGIVFFFLQPSKTANSPDLLSLQLNNNENMELIEENEDAHEDEKWVVDVKGEVRRPGVYVVTSEQRIYDVIELAGGFTENAEEKVINLAAKIMDEMVIYVPKIGEEVQTQMPSLWTESANQSEDGKIHINMATMDEITTLNGIGPKKAQAIIDYRDENGPFQTIDDLLQVSGIGEKTLESLRDDIVIP